MMHISRTARMAGGFPVAGELSRVLRPPRHDCGIRFSFNANRNPKEHKEQNYETVLIRLGAKLKV